MGHGSIYTLSIVSIFHLKDGQNFANFFKSFLAAEFMRHTLIPIIKTGREWTFLIPILSSLDDTENTSCSLFYWPPYILLNTRMKRMINCQRWMNCLLDEHVCRHKNIPFAQL